LFNPKEPLRKLTCRKLRDPKEYLYRKGSAGTNSRAPESGVNIRGTRPRETAIGPNPKEVSILGRLGDPRE